MGIRLRRERIDARLRKVFGWRTVRWMSGLIELVSVIKITTEVEIN